MDGRDLVVVDIEDEQVVECAQRFGRHDGKQILREV